MNKTKRRSTIAVSAVLLASMVAAPAGASDRERGSDFSEMRGYGIEFGSVVHEHPSGEMTLMSLTIEWRGSSYASTDHPTWIDYYGKSRAMGNVWNNQRWVRASHKYSRDGVDLIPWLHSNASQNPSSCTWTAGTERNSWVRDNLWPWGPKTQWHYSFVWVWPNVC